MARMNIKTATYKNSNNPYMLSAFVLPTFTVLQIWNICLFLIILFAN